MRAYLIAVPILMTVHNLEELVGGLPALRPALQARLPEALAPLVGSADGWLLAIVVVTVIPWAALLLGGLDRHDSPAARTLVAVQAVMTFNVLSHVGGAVLLRGYSPGIVTSLLLYVPFSARFFPRAWREEWVTRRLMRWLPGIVLVLHGPGLLGLLALCSMIVT